MSHNIHPWDLFPWKFHEQDTYLDDKGRGLLQRFIELGTEYFNESLLDPINKFLDFIDVDKTEDRYLPYLWEYLGFIPYASQPSIVSRVTIGLPLPRQRELLKYAIALYKIRTTHLFYQILGALYGINLTLEEQADNVSSDAYNNQRSKYDDKSIYKPTIMSLACVGVIAKVGLPVSLIDYMSTTPGATLDTKQNICNIINPYLPVHVKELTPQDVLLSEISGNTTLYLP